MVGHRLHIGHRDAVTLGIGGDFFNFGDQAAHQIAADKHQPLGGLQFHALACGGKAPGNPVRQHALGLLGEFQLGRQRAQRLDKLQPAVRLKLRVLHERYRAVIRDILQHLQQPVGGGQLVQIRVPYLHKAVLAQKRHGVHCLLQVLCVQLRPVETAVAEAVLHLRQAEGLEQRKILFP